MASFCGGTSISSTQIEMPARVASLNPACISLSAKITVSCKPHAWKAVLIRREISFFFSARFISENGKPGGRIRDSIARPAVVGYRVRCGINFGESGDFPRCAEIYPAAHPVPNNGWTCDAVPDSAAGFAIFGDEPGAEEKRNFTPDQYGLPRMRFT